jgi:hypothetical protein
MNEKREKAASPHSHPFSIPKRQTDAFASSLADFSSSPYRFQSGFYWSRLSMTKDFAEISSKVEATQKGVRRRGGD